MRATPVRRGGRPSEKSLAVPSLAILRTAAHPESHALLRHRLACVLRNRLGDPRRSRHPPAASRRLDAQGWGAAQRLGDLADDRRLDVVRRHGRPLPVRRRLVRARRHGTRAVGAVACHLRVAGLGRRGTRRRLPRRGRRLPARGTFRQLPPGSRPRQHDGLRPDLRRRPSAMGGHPRRPEAFRRPALAGRRPGPGPAGIGRELGAGRCRRTPLGRDDAPPLFSGTRQEHVPARAGRPGITAFHSRARRDGLVCRVGRRACLPVPAPAARRRGAASDDRFQRRPVRPPGLVLDICAERCRAAAGESPEIRGVGRRNDGRVRAGLPARPGQGRHDAAGGPPRRHLDDDGRRRGAPVQRGRHHDGGLADLAGHGADRIESGWQRLDGHPGQPVRTVAGRRLVAARRGRPSDPGKRPAFRQPGVRTPPRGPGGRGARLALAAEVGSIRPRHPASGRRRSHHGAGRRCTDRAALDRDARQGTRPLAARRVAAERRRLGPAR